MTALFDRLTAALAAPVAARAPAARSDGVPLDLPPVPAAVLMAITDRPQPGLILTERTSHLRTHAGQVALPGGRIDGDEDPATAALREAFEELGLDPAQVRLIGPTDAYQTGTGYAVTPVVGVIPPDLPLRPNPAEVAGWFEVPLDHLTDPAHWQRRQVQYQGRMRSYYESHWDGHRIWGATAAMLMNLARRTGPWR